MERMKWQRDFEGNFLNKSELKHCKEEHEIFSGLLHPELTKWSLENKVDKSKEQR